MRLAIEHLRLLGAVVSIASTIAVGTGCEVSAASETVEVTLERVSQRDIDDPARLIFVVASVNDGACVEGPCSPSPCPDDEAATTEGRTYCIGLGDQHQCVCPPDQYFDDMTSRCQPETNCDGPGNRVCGGDPPGFPVRGGASGSCSEGNIVCNCNPGYVGTFCEECDTAAGYVRNGENFCSLPDPSEKICRDGQGKEEFAALLESAEEELGHAPVELELSSAKMEISGTPEGVRSWDYLFSGPVTLFLQPVSGFPSNAGTAELPPTERGLEPIEFDMNITRATLSGDPQFKSGDFTVGISAPTNRIASEMFSADIKLILEFKAY